MAMSNAQWTSVFIAKYLRLASRFYSTRTHVDDFAVFPTCEAMFEELLAVLKSKYDITVTDRLEKPLGMHVNQYENDAVGLSQPKHLQVMFDLCGFGDEHVGADIPMPVDWNEADQDDSPKIDIEVYVS